MVGARFGVRVSIFSVTRFTVEDFPVPFGSFSWTSFLSCFSQMKHVTSIFLCNQQAHIVLLLVDQSLSKRQSAIFAAARTESFEAPRYTFSQSLDAEFPQRR